MTFFRRAAAVLKKTKTKPESRKQEAEGDTRRQEGQISIVAATEVDIVTQPFAAPTGETLPRPP